MTDMLYTLTETFLELLLLTLTSVNHNLLSKIDEDFNIISSLCLQYKGIVPSYYYYYYYCCHYHHYY